MPNKLEPFYKLIDDLKTIMAEYDFAVKETFVKGKHAIGERIVNDPIFERGENSAKIIKRVAEEIGRSERDVYSCVQFYQAYPNVETAFQEIAPNQKALSWRSVIRHLQAPKAECGHQETTEIVFKIVRTRCDHCGKIVEEVRESL